MLPTACGAAEADRRFGSHCPVIGRRDLLQDAGRQPFLPGTPEQSDSTAYSAEEIIGRHVSILVPPECSNDLSEILASTRRGERISRRETVRTAKGGRRLQVSLTVSPITDESGNVIGASTIAHDITKRKCLEEQLRESHAVLERRIADRTRELSKANSRLQREIAERRAANESLRVREEELRSLLDNSPDMILKTDPNLRTCFEIA